MSREIDLSKMRIINTRFTLTMSKGDWETSIPSEGETTFKNVTGLEALHLGTQSLGEYVISLAFPQARSMESPVVERLARTLELKFKKRVKLVDVEKALLGSGIVEDIEIPTFRTTPEDLDRFNIMS